MRTGDDKSLRADDRASSIGELRCTWFFVSFDSPLAKQRVKEMKSDSMIADFIVVLVLILLMKKPILFPYRMVPSRFHGPDRARFPQNP